MDPANLPPELFAQVLDSALAQSDAQQLCGLSLLSHKRYSTLVARIYSEWTYDGAQQSFIQLWNFLRTVVRNPRLGATIRTLDIGNWGFNPHVRLGEKLGFDPAPDELELVRTTIRNAGIGQLESDIIQSLHRGDRRPLMAILLTCLPNVTKISAHVPLLDPILGAVLKQTLDYQLNNPASPALRNLQELSLFGEVPVPIEKSEVRCPIKDPVPLQLNDLWPVLHFPSLRKLSIYEFETEGTASLLHNSGVSHIQHLTLTTYKRSDCRASDIRALLDLPQALSSFALYVNDGRPQPPRVESKISNTEICNALQQHQDSLQSLDIFRQGHHPNPTCPFGNFGCIQSFPQLKRLSIQVSVLFGIDHDMEDPPSLPFRLKDALPPTLQSLTLYWCHEMYSIPDMAVQLQDVLSEGFSSLKSLTLEDGNYMVSYRDVLLETFQKELQQANASLQVESGCSELHHCGQFHVRERCLFQKAGQCQLSWGASYKIREDGHKRNERITQELFPNSDDDNDDDDSSSDSSE